MRSLHFFDDADSWSIINSISIRRPINGNPAVLSNSVETSKRHRHGFELRESKTAGVWGIAIVGVGCAEGFSWLADILQRMEYLHGRRIDRPVACSRVELPVKAHTVAVIR